MLGTELIEKPTSFHTQTSFERAGRIVHSAVNHSTVVRAGVEAWTRMTLEHTRRQSALGNGSRRCESADTRPNDGNIDAFHVVLFPVAILPSCNGLTFTVESSLQAGPTASTNSWRY